MRTQGDMEAMTKGEALRFIANKLGFPKPSPRYLWWYFNIDDDGLYTPRVDFDSLAKDIAEGNFIERLANVIGLPQHHADREGVFREIYNTIKKHEF